VTLRGSRRFKPEGAKIVGPVDAKEPVVVSVYLKNPAERQHVPGSAADLAALARSTTTRRKLARQRPSSTRRPSPRSRSSPGQAA
jgi:hypothetical protein